MKRAGLILVSGLLLGLLAYLGFYHLGTASSRRLEQSDAPELAWLKTEYHLGDAEFSRICQLHQGYLAGCAERCRRIDAEEERLKELLAKTNAMTPEIEQSLKTAALLRADCQKQMLQHFFEVSRTMPAAEGQRYLAWVQGRTVCCESHAEMSGMEHEHHHH